MSFDPNYYKQGKLIDEHFVSDGNQYFFCLPRVTDTRLPISAELWQWGTERLRTRMFVVRVVSYILIGVGAIWMFWQGLLHDSWLVGSVGFLLPLPVTFFISAAVGDLTLRPFKIQLMKFQGWKRRGLKRALFDLGYIWGRHFLLLIGVAFLFFRGTTDYFGLIEWKISSWQSDFEGVATISLAVAVISLLVLSSALAYEPPEHVE